MKDAGAVIVMIKGCSYQFSKVLIGGHEFKYIIKRTVGALNATFQICYILFLSKINISNDHTIVIKNRQ